jgi:hypothetical protein
MASNLRGHAVTYAERGWPVLPLVPRAKTPLVKNGLLDASADLSIVLRWWERWPSANIGIRTGVAFDVLDIDGDDGQVSYLNLMPEGYIGNGPVSRTKNGFHLLFNPMQSQNRQHFLPGLDWRGTNGYIVAPPSIHPSGFTYYWQANPDTHPLNDVPDWLTPHVLAYKAPVEYASIIPNPHDPLNDILQAALAIGLQPVRKGSRYVVACIFHTGDNEASLTLYPDQRFFCFGCGAWGSARDLRERRYGGRRG